MKTVRALCFRSILVAVTFSLALITPLARAAGGGSSSDGSDAIADVQEAIDDQNYSQAIELLSDFLADNPESADALNLMGYSFRKSGQIEQALGYYQKALHIEPEHRGANEYLGELYLQRNELDNAEQRLSVLDDACFMPCEEYTDLKRLIAEYRQRKGLN